MKEAEERLIANGQQKVCWDDIAALKDKFSLSDQVELGLKLLHPVKLRLLLGTREELERQMGNAEAEEREQLVRAFIAKFDPIVEKLVQKIELKQVELKQEMERTAAEEDGVSDGNSAADPAEQEAPGAGLGVRVPPRCKGGGKPVSAKGARSRSPHRDDSAWTTWRPGSSAYEVNKKGEMINNGKGDWKFGSRNGKSDSRQPSGSTASSDDLDTFLVKCKLDAFARELRELGVERLADLKYVTEEDLKGMGMSIIQCRKFRETSQAWTGGNPQPPRKTDALPSRPGKGSNKPKGGTWHEESAASEKADAPSKSVLTRRRTGTGVIGARAQHPQSKHSQKSTSAGKHRPARGGETDAATADWSVEESKRNDEQDGKAASRWSSGHWQNGDEASWSW